MAFWWTSGWLVFGLSLLSRFFDLISHAVACSLDGDGVGMMEHSIQNGAGQGGVIVEDLTPLFVWLVGGEDGAGFFIAAADHLEKKVSSGLVDGNVAHLVTDKHPWLEVFGQFLF